MLSAIAGGSTQFGEILSRSGTERGSLSFYLKTLIELGWVRRELPFEETSEKRGLYQTQVEPLLSDYMSRFVFESICHQWLEKNAHSVLSLPLMSAGRWWSRDGQIEIDVMAKEQGGGYVFGECKWSRNTLVGMNVYARLLSEVERLPEARHRKDPTLVLFSLGGFLPEVIACAASPQNRLYLHTLSQWIASNTVQLSSVRTVSDAIRAACKNLLRAWENCDIKRGSASPQFGYHFL